jgi:hypothetical protein
LIVAIARCDQKKGSETQLAVLCHLTVGARPGLSLRSGDRVGSVAGVEQTQGLAGGSIVRSRLRLATPAA